MDPKGKIVLELGPKPKNPRNSEGAFSNLKDGRIIFIYSRFNHISAADNAPADLAAVWSDDKGESWSDEKVILSAQQDQAENIMSVSLNRMQNGDLGLFYFIRRGFGNGKVYLRRSADEGKTWGEAICCVPARGYYVTNNDRVIRLKDGRLILPTGYHRTIFSQNGRSETWDSRSTTIYFLSDDDGTTWHESSPCAIQARCSRSGLQEPGVVELKNGSLYGWARTDLGAQYEMFSFDRGNTWTAPQPSRFTSPCSPLSMKRDEKTNHLIAIFNPIPEYITRPRQTKTWNGGRTPLVCSVSRDEGQTWDELLILEDDPDSGYCYTAMHFYEDSLLLAYCAGSPADGGCLNRLRIRKMPVPGRS